MLRRAKHRTTSPASSGRKKATSWRMIFTPPPLAISPGHDVGQRHAVAHNTDESSSPRTMAALRSLPPLRGGSSSPGTKERGPAVSVCVCVCACFYSCACTVCMPRGRADSRYTCPLSLSHATSFSLSPSLAIPPRFSPPLPSPRAQPGRLLSLVACAPHRQDPVAALCVCRRHHPTRRGSGPRSRRAAVVQALQRSLLQRTGLRGGCVLQRRVRDQLLDLARRERAGDGRARESEGRGRGGR